MQPPQPRSPAESGAVSATSLDVSFCKLDARATFRALLHYLPVSLAVREIMRMRALAEAGRLPTPLLDIGCGDGLFWEVLTRDLTSGRSSGVRGLVGVDISESELRLASLRLSPLGGEVHAFDISHDGKERALDDRLGAFETVIANCSLEHVPKLEVALENIKRYLAPKGELWLFVPAPRWSDTFVVKRALRALGSRAAGTYGGMWDGFYQHHHLYPAWVWSHLLKGLGFEIEIRGLGCARGNRLAELWLPPALMSFVYKSVFGHYPARLSRPFKLPLLPRMSAYLDEVQRGEVITSDLEHPEVVEYAIRCRRA
ncbi:MAG: class I SAM-dependent methyltransferase [Planctomycetes bacterium]|nr:class I SAM-dependent methyltransferase [Planctomycetota bacterium]